MSLRRSALTSGSRREGRRPWRTLVVAAAALGLAVVTTACGSGSGKLAGIGENGLYGSIPAAASGTQHTGTIKLAQLSGMTPWILPIVNAANYSIYTTTFFDYDMWRPLYWFPSGTSQTEDKAESLASDPVFSDGDKTATIKLKSTAKWSDGQPVTSKDVQFTLDEMKAAVKESPANYATYAPGLGLPDQIASVSAPDASTAVFHFTKPINPSFFLANQMCTFQVMPAHAWAKDSAGGKTLDFTQPGNAKKIYDYLASQSKSLKTYASNPLWQVVDGPYKLTAFNTVNQDWSMAPNKNYWGPTGKAVSPVQMSFYASDEAEFNAVKSGAADVGYVPMADVPKAASLKSKYSLFGYPGLGFHAVFYNFKDTTGHFNKIIGQLYIRQALAHLDDQKGLIHAIYNGAGAPSYGPVGKYPTLPYTPPDAQTDPYPYSVATAKSILTSHGWKVVPNGTTTCVKPGSGSNECGSGIPAGTKLAWNMPYAADNSTSVNMATAFASALKSVGMSVTLKSSTFANIIENDNDPAVPKNDNSWAMELFGGESFQGPYASTIGLFNSTGSGNIGGYSDPKADKLINASVSGSNPMALKDELSYITQQQPVFFEPAEDYASAGGLMAISKQISGPPDSFSAYTQDYLLPEFWYFTK